jgi:hypothetical protein
MILGMVKTTSGRGTLRRKCWPNQTLQASHPLAWHNGQECLVLQEKVRNGFLLSS